MSKTGPTFYTVWYNQKKAESLPEYLNRDEIILFRTHAQELHAMKVAMMIDGFRWNETAVAAFADDATFWQTAAWIVMNREVAVQLWGTQIGASRWMHEG